MTMVYAKNTALLNTNKIQRLSHVARTPHLNPPPGYKGRKGERKNGQRAA